MKNYTRIIVERQGYVVARLIDDEGDFLEPFDAFMDSLTAQGLSQSTVTRYGYVVASFLDFLTEAGVFGQVASRRDILKVVSQYVPTLLNANEHIMKATKGLSATTRWDELAHTLRIRQLSKASLPNTLAAINGFLKLSVENHQLTVEETQFQLSEVSYFDSPKQLFRAPLHKLSRYEQKALMRGSMLATVMRLNPSGVKRPGEVLKYKSPNISNIQNEDALDFPMLYLRLLFQRATSSRDRAYWLLLAAGGLRGHEAEQLRLPDIDFRNRLVFVEDPHDLRYSSQLPDRYKLKFKGRTVSQTYLMQPFRDLFFDALEDYLSYPLNFGH